MTPKRPRARSFAEITKIRKEAKSLGEVRRRVMNSYLGRTEEQMQEEENEKEV